MLIIMIMILSRTEYIDVYTFDTTTSAGAAITLLKENGIETQLADDKVTVRADEKRNRSVDSGLQHLILMKVNLR